MTFSKLKGLRRREADGGGGGGAVAHVRVCPDRVLIICIEDGVTAVSFVTFDLICPVWMFTWFIMNHWYKIDNKTLYRSPFSATRNQAFNSLFR